MYGLIGKKLIHSFSANYFNNKFAEEGINNEYRLFSLPSIDKFPELLESHPDLEGLNVTLPYKQQIIPYLDALSEESEKIGAVNVIKFDRTGGKLKLIGYNSDIIGFRESLLPLLHKDIQKALILGTGGASKAVKYVLENLGIDVTFVSRNPEPGMMDYKGMDRKIINDNLLIVNTTPLGMFPDISSYPPIPYQYLTPRHVCYDLVYNPLETEFLKRSGNKGAITKNGIEMLYGQAIGSWEIWNEQS